MGTLSRKHVSAGTETSASRTAQIEEGAAQIANIPCIGATDRYATRYASTDSKPNSSSVVDRPITSIINDPNKGAARNSHRADQRCVATDADSDLRGLFSKRVSSVTGTVANVCIQVKVIKWTPWILANESL